MNLRTMSIACRINTKPKFSFKTCLFHWHAFIESKRIRSGEDVRILRAMTNVRTHIKTARTKAIHLFDVSITHTRHSSDSKAMSCCCHAHELWFVINFATFAALSGFPCIDKMSYLWVSLTFSRSFFLCGSITRFLWQRQLIAVKDYINISHLFAKCETAQISIQFRCAYWKHWTFSFEYTELFDLCVTLKWIVLWSLLENE